MRWIFISAWLFGCLCGLTATVGEFIIWALNHDDTLEAPWFKVLFDIGFVVGGITLFVCFWFGLAFLIFVV